MIRQIAKGFGMDDSPGPSNAGWLSTGSAYLGTIPLVQSQGRFREATYRQIYLLNPWVYSAVNMISRGVARLPLHVFQLDERGRKQRVRGDLPATPGRPTSGQTLDRLLSKPAGGTSLFAQYGGTMIDRLVYGNALWEMKLDSNRQISELQRIRWRSVVSAPFDSNGWPLYYEVGPLLGAGPTRKISPEDVIHFGYNSDPEGVLGVSPLESCRHTLALHDAVMRHLVAYFGNAARPSGYIKVDKLTPEKAQSIRQMITEIWSSPENAGKILVGSGDWQATADSPDHSQIAELVKLSREEIAASFAVPPPVLGILDRAIRSNVKELREQYVRDCLGPWAAEVEGELEAQLLGPTPSWSNLFLEFQLAEQLRPDLEARALVYQRLASIYTIDEIRAFENAPPLDIPGVSDVPWVPSGAMPLTTAAKGKAPAIQAPADPVPATTNGHAQLDPEVLSL